MSLVSASSRRFGIAIGLPRCDKMDYAPLPRVESDVGRFVEFLQSQEYTRVLEQEIPMGASSQIVKNELSHWFANPNRCHDDTVVVYFASHGGPAGKTSAHFLFATDSDPREPDTTAIETATLARIFFNGEGVRPQNVLLILDTCYSGSGGGQAASLVAATKGDLRDAPGSGFWIVASAGPRSGAADGAFIEALLASIGTENCSPQGNSEFVALHELVEQINEWLLKNGRPQRAEIDTIGGQRNQRFFRNVNFTSQFDGLELRDEAHWNPKARGVDEFTSAGWFFTGRKAARHTLVRWLRTKQSDGCARVVLGRPGSGKSAVLGWLVLCSNSASRARMENAGVSMEAEVTPHLESIGAAVHARGASPEHVLNRLATQLKVTATNAAGLIDTLGSRSGPIGIVVDALDESLEPARLERELLEPLAATQNVRLIVASRTRHDRVPLSGVSTVIDLDDPEYYQEEDIAQYAEARLTTTVLGEPRFNAEEAHRIAARIAEKAAKSFLYARIVSRGLTNNAAIDASTDHWEKDLQLPTSLWDAFAADLDRFPIDQRKRFVDLLLPLAYSRGKGLPQKHIWCRLASRIAGLDKNHAYTNRDIRELKDVAGFYIVQDTEFGEVVFRLFHQAFADYLKRVSRDEGVEETIVEVLWSLDNSQEGSGRWLRRSEPYVEHYLATHAAAAAGILDRLLIDPLFLVHADVYGLLSALSTAKLAEDVDKNAQIYARVSHQLKTARPGERAFYLEVAARQNGAVELAGKIAQLPLTKPCRVPWMHWRPSSAFRVLTTHDDAVFGVAVGEVGHRPVIVSGAIDGSVRTSYWDDGELLYPQLIGKATITALTVGKVGDRDTLLCGYADGTVNAWDLADGSLLRTISGTHEGGVTALATAPLGSRSAIIAITRRGELTIHSLDRSEPTGISLHPQLISKPDSDAFVSAAIWFAGREIVIASGGYLGTVRLWSVAIEEDLQWRRATTAKILNEWRGHKSLVNAVAIETWNGQLIIASGSTDGTVGVWAAQKHDPLYLLTGHRNVINCVAIAKSDAKVILSGDCDGVVRAWKLTDGNPLCDQFIGHIGRVFAVAGGLSGSWPIIVSGGQDRTVRSWYIDDRTEHCGSIGPVTSVAVGTIDRDAIVVSRGQDGRIRLWDFANGEPFQTKPSLLQRIATFLKGFKPAPNLMTMSKEGGSIGSTAVGSLAGKPILPSVGDSDQTVWSLATGELLAQDLGAGWEAVQAVAIAEIDDRCLIVSGHKDNRLRVWDLTNHRMLYNEPLRYQGPIDLVTVGKLGREAIIVSASYLGKIWVHSFRNGEPLYPFLRGLEAGVSSLAVGMLDKHQVILSGSSDGSLGVWNLATGEQFCPLLKGHSGPVTAVAAGRLGDKLRIISGSLDGTLRVWGMDNWGMDNVVAIREIPIGSQVYALVLKPPHSLVLGAELGLLVVDFGTPSSVMKLSAPGRPTGRPGKCGIHNEYRGIEPHKH